MYQFDLNIKPSSVFYNPIVDVIRYDCLGNTGRNKDEIIRSIKANYDRNINLNALTICVNVNDPNSSEKQQLAYIIEYSDGHVELYDRHSMSINRQPRESEVLAMLRSITYLGFGERIFFVTKRLPYQVFKQAPLNTITLIKSKSVKRLLPFWHDFTTVNNESMTPYSKSIYQQSDWEDINKQTSIAINHVEEFTPCKFKDIISFNDFVTIGYIGRRFDTWMFMIKRGRKALITTCKQDYAVKLKSVVESECKLNCFGDTLPDNFLISKAQKLISLNQYQYLTKYDIHHQKWLFRD